MFDHCAPLYVPIDEQVERVQQELADTLFASISMSFMLDHLYRRSI